MSAQRLHAATFIAHSGLVSAKHRQNIESGGNKTPEAFTCLLLILLPLASCSLCRTIPVCWIMLHGDPLAVFLPFQNT